MTETAAFWTAPEELIASPTYQVNLLLWMTQAQNRARVTPLFARAGFEVVALEERITLSPDLNQRLRSNGFKASQPVAPDFILKSKKDYLIVECKRSMFGSDSTAQRQATSLLALVPRRFENSRSMQAGSAHAVALAYLSRHDDEHDELQGVLSIREKLLSAKIPVVEVGFLGLNTHDNHVEIQCGDRGALPKRLADTVSNDPTVQAIEPGVDIRFLYIIPWLPQSESERDDYHKAVLAERVKVNAAEIVERARIGRDLYIRTSDILGRLLMGVEKFWKNTSALSQLRQEVATILKKQFAKLPKDAPAAIPQPDMAWAFSIRDQTDKDKLIGAVMSPGAYDYKDAPMQLTLDSEKIRIAPSDGSSPESNGGES